MATDTSDTDTESDVNEIDKREIDCISKIDFAKGFQSFYVKWQISNCDKPKYSPNFVTKISNVDGEASFSWQLYIRDYNDEPEETVFGLRLLTDGKSVPVVYRISLSSTKESFFDTCEVDVCDTYNEAWGHFCKAAEVSKFTSDNMVFRCWIDIPNAIVLGCDIEVSDDDNDDQPIRKKRRDEFSSYNSELFEAVANGKDELSDITLAILKKKEIVHRFLVHRYILAARSPVFRCMFANKQWKENAAKNERILEIDDIDKETMEIVLKYVYTSVLPNESVGHGQVFKIIYMADKYDLAELKNYCVSLLIGKYDFTKLRVAQLKLADRHTLDQLKAVCVAQLSMDFAYCEDEKARDNIPGALLSEIIGDVCRRQEDTTVMTLPAA